MPNVIQKLGEEISPRSFGFMDPRTFLLGSAIAGGIHALDKKIGWFVESRLAPFPKQIPTYALPKVKKIYAVFIAPILEEYLYRGLGHQEIKNLQRDTNSFQSQIVRCGMSSSLFTAMHFKWKNNLKTTLKTNARAMPTLFIAACAFSAVAEATNSLAPSIIAHMGMNFLAVSRGR